MNIIPLILHRMFLIITYCCIYSVTRVTQGNRTEIMNIENTATTVLDLKKQIEVVFLVPARQQKLVCKGTILNDQQLIRQTKISDHCKIVIFKK